MLLVSALTTLSLLVTGMAPVDWGLAPAASAAPDEPVSSKDVVAADMVSAAAMARLRDAEVEVEGLRTQTARTFALPDGSVRVEEHAGIQRFRGPGGKWVEVDLDLVADPRGVLRPKAHPIGVALAGGGQAGDLVSAAAGTAEDGTARVVALGWAGEIPKPTVSGATATYPEVAKGVDAKVVVTRSGFEQFFVIKSRAAARSGLSWELPLRTEGLAVRGEVDGSVSFTDPAGEVVSRLGSASAWDASIDERVGDQRSKVSPVGMRVEQNAPDRATLRITPDPGWLLDADREFPVIIDPSYTDSSAPVFDTFVQSGCHRISPARVS